MKTRNARPSTARKTSTARATPTPTEAQPEAPTHGCEGLTLEPAPVPRDAPPDNDTAENPTPSAGEATPAPTEDAPTDSPPAVEDVPSSAIVRVDESTPVRLIEPSDDEGFEQPRANEAPTAQPKGRSFLDVYEAVQRRAGEMLPDQVVHVADLRMTPGGHVELPGGARYRINPHAKRQVSSLLGLRWDRWFQSASGEERAEEVNRRFARIPGKLKVRAWRDGTGEADGVARAFLASTFTPIDDARVFERMHTMMRGLMDEYRFTNVEFTDTTTHYTAVHAEPFDLDGEPLHAGWHLRNSEVGASALSLDDHWLRLVCANGLMVRVGGKRSLYRTHRAIEDDQLAAALVIAVGRLPERWRATFTWMQAAKRAAVPHPDDAVAAVLGDSAEVPRAMLEEAQREVLRAGDATRFGVVQAITLVAHAKNSDPDVRFAMERLAGDYLAAPQAVAA